MSAFIEKYGPIVISVISVSVLYYFRTSITISCDIKAIDFTTLYSSSLNWSSIQTGFIFGVFGFVAGKKEGFIAAVQNTSEMKLFSGYMRTAMALGFFVTMTSIPLVVLSFSVSSSVPWHYHVFCAWAFLSIWSFFAFWRVAYIFGILIRPKDRVVLRG